MARSDWWKFLRWNKRPPADQVSEKRRDIERNRQAFDLVGTAVFRDTFHEELDDLVDAWLIEKSPEKAERLRYQAQELLALGQRMQARAQRHHDSITAGQHRKTGV